MGLIADLVGDTNKKCFGTKRMPSVKKYQSVSRKQLATCVVGAVLDNFEELDVPEGKCRGTSCRKKGEYELDEIYLCRRCLMERECSKAIQPLVDEILARYDEHFGVNDSESDERSDSYEQSDSYESS